MQDDRIKKSFRDLNVRCAALEKRCAELEQRLASNNAAILHLITGSQAEFDSQNIIHRTTVYVLREVFGHLKQFDAYLQAILPNLPKGALDHLPTAEELTDSATEWYHRVFGVMHKVAKEEMEEERTKKSKELQEEKAKQNAAEKARVDAEEQKMAEEVLNDSGLKVVEAGRSAPQYPPEATIFEG